MMSRPAIGGILAVALVLILGSCSTREAVPGFTISLAGSGDVILSDEHIAQYDPARYLFVLTPQGAERWKSFIPFDDSFDPPIPKLGPLAGKEFVVKIGDQEMYRGHFWSMVMSSMRKGVLIYDTLISTDHLAVSIERLGDETFEDPRGRPEIVAYFRENDKLR